MMWVWCFQNWVVLIKNIDENGLSFECDRFNFWLYLNNYNQLFGTDDEFDENE